MYFDVIFNKIILINGNISVTVVPLHQHHPDSMAHPSSPATVLPERAWQDSIIALSETPPISPCQTPLQHGSSENSNSDSTAGQWNFNDPTRKISCSCFK